MNGVAATATAAVLASAEGIQGGHIVHPVAVRAKIPLKTKVREKNRRARKNLVARASKSAKSVAVKPRKRLALFAKSKSSELGGRRKQRAANTKNAQVSTKEKVQSWLERENPIQQVIDNSDAESHFPDDDILNDGVEQEETVPQLGRDDLCQVAVGDLLHVDECLRSASSDVNLAAATGANGGAHNGDLAVRSLSSSAEVLTQSRSSANLIQQDHHGRSVMMPNLRMIRSISECQGRKAHGGVSNKFSRSVSHQQESELRKLKRGIKSESNSHLLSKSELEIADPKVAAVADTQLAERLAGCEDDAAAAAAVSPVRKAEPITHPTANIFIPARIIPKSATDGKLKAMAQRKKHQLAASFEFLNFSSSASRQRAAAGAPAAAAKRNTKEPSKTTKALALGPVKVVLKWHGVSGVRSKSKASDRPGAKTKEKKSNCRKRVIVYNNGDNKYSNEAGQAAEQPLELAKKNDAAKDSSTDERSTKRHTKINITDNPMQDVIQAQERETADDGAVPARRFSMHAPKLTRHYSNVDSLNQTVHRRNRHSWCADVSSDLHIDIDTDKE